MTPHVNSHVLHWVLATMAIVSFLMLAFVIYKTVRIDKQAQKIVVVTTVNKGNIKHNTEKLYGNEEKIELTKEQINELCGGP